MTIVVPCSCMKTPFQSSGDITQFLRLTCSAFTGFFKKIKVPCNFLIMNFWPSNCGLLTFWLSFKFCPFIHFPIFPFALWYEIYCPFCLKCKIYNLNNKLYNLAISISSPPRGTQVKQKVKLIYKLWQLTKLVASTDWSFFHNIAGTELPQISMENMTQQIWENNNNIAESFVIPNTKRLTNTVYLSR